MSTSWPGLFNLHANFSVYSRRQLVALEAFRKCKYIKIYDIETTVSVSYLKVKLYNARRHEYIYYIH